MTTHRVLFSLASVGLMLGAGVLRCPAQTPVMRWAFDAGNGVPRNTTWISGGILSLAGGAGGHVTFQSSGGVGAATPGVFNGAGNVYGDNYAAVRINSENSPLIADAELPQFVVTLWIKPTTLPSDQPYARLLNISPADDEKASPGLFVALHETNLEVGINGAISQVRLPSGAIRQGEWTFLVLVYDGFAANPYYSAEMMAAVKAERNTTVLVGGIESPAKVAETIGLNTGAPSYNVPVGPLPIHGLSVAVGSGNGNGSRAFLGLIDDVRIYGGLLTLAQIGAVRASALAQP